MAISQNPWEYESQIMPPKKPKQVGFEDIPPIRDGDNLSIGDAVNYSANAANQYFKDLGPLQAMVADLYKNAMGGNIPEAVAPLIAGRMASTGAAIPQAQRIATDTMAPGGALQETLANIPQQMIAQRAQATQDVLEPLQAGAIDAGSNVTARGIQPLMSAAQIRVGQKAAENSGGKK